MDRKALRDHAKLMLEEIVEDIDLPESKLEQKEKSKGRKPQSVNSSAAVDHGLDRLDHGFHITILISEYRYLRASILRLWYEQRPKEVLDVYELIRFNEAVDQLIQESVDSYSTEKEQQARQITAALRKSEEELQLLNRELEKRVERGIVDLLESQKQVLHTEKLASIGKLSASIAHEFNNPLQGILSVLKGLKKRATMEAEDRELLNSAIDEGHRIRDLIRSLQDFNRPSSGKKALMDVHHALDSMLILQKSELAGRRISLERNYADGLPLISAVSDQLKQVFLNLLANAADACEKRNCVITVSTWHENNGVAVSIKDTGIGIKPEEIKHIFRPFYTTKAAVKGTGLGLSVSYGIVKNHQGEIRVESKPGEGSTFTVLLPIKGGEETPAVADMKID